MYMVINVEGNSYKALIVPQTKPGAHRFKAVVDSKRSRVTVFANTLSTLRRRARTAVILMLTTEKHDMFVERSWRRRLARWFYQTAMRWHKPWYRQTWGLKGDIIYGWGPTASDWEEHIELDPSLVKFYEWYTGDTVA